MKRTVLTGLGLALVLALGACGSDDPDCGANPLAAGCPPPPPTTLPAQRPPVVLDSGSGRLEFLTVMVSPRSAGL